MRQSTITRDTAETKIRLSLALDGTGKGEIATGVGFLNHMLTLFAAHGRFDLTIVCEGDTWVDDHHSVEDVGIALGAAFRQALGDKRGVRRYGSLCLPMDEALVLCAVDLSGRSCLRCALDIPTEKVGTFDTELNFIPVRGDFARGIFVSTYMTSDLTIEQAYDLYNDFYKESDL